jgi:hypothetical protein
MNRYTPYHRLPLALFAVIMGLTAGCGEDPMGHENRLALLAWGRCQPDEAERLVAAALAGSEPEARYHALVLKAAMRREAGDSAGAAALYPQMAAEWEAAKDKPLNERRRERDITMRLKIAESERHMQGLAADCSDGATADRPR